MRNLLAMLVTLIAFAITVAVVNAQTAALDAPLSFDIRKAVETISNLVFEAIGTPAKDYGLPYAAELGLGAFALAIPCMIVFALLAKRG